MGHETISGQGYSGDMASLQETDLYAELEPAELIHQYYETEGDDAIGIALSVRLFEHAGVTDDPRVVPLIGRDGEQVVVDGKHLMLSDYVNFAAAHHFEALEGILDFLMQKRGEPDYESTQATILGRLNAGRP